MSLFNKKKSPTGDTKTIGPAETIEDQLQKTTDRAKQLLDRYSKYNVTKFEFKNDDRPELTINITIKQLAEVIQNGDFDYISGFDTGRRFKGSDRTSSEFMITLYSTENYIIYGLIVN